MEKVAQLAKSRGKAGRSKAESLTDGSDLLPENWSI